MVEWMVWELLTNQSARVSNGHRFSKPLSISNFLQESRLKIRTIIKWDKVVLFHGKDRVPEQYYTDLSSNNCIELPWKRIYFAVFSRAKQEGGNDWGIKW